MSGERVHLFDLRERTSVKGTRYLSGWLGKASVVAFLDREAEEPTWHVFVATPQSRSAGYDQSERPSRLGQHKGSRLSAADNGGAHG